MRGVCRKIPVLNLMSKQESADMQEAVLKVLAETGIVFEDPAVQKEFNEQGCQVDFTTGCVKMPEKFVKSAISAVPECFTLKTRQKKNEVTITSDASITNFALGGATKLYDKAHKFGRVATRKEFYDNLTLADALPNLDMNSAFPLWGFENVPECMVTIESAAAKLRVGGKAQLEGAVFDEYQWITQMGKAAGADIVQLANSASPLTYYRGVTDRIRFFAKNDVPIQFAPGPFKGMTCPVTNAGAVVSNNAETLAGMIYAQLVCPGSRVWAASMILTPNMANGLPAFGDIGQSLHEAAFNQYWRDMHIPNVSCSNAWTSAMVADYQAGYELSIMALLSSLTGAAVIQCIGGLNAQLTYSAAKAVMDNDMVGMIKRFLEGVRVTKETLAAELIHEVGPLPGCFIDTDHTFEHWREECYIPRAAVRSNRVKYSEDGEKNAEDIAALRYEEILSTHKAKKLTPPQEAEIEYILQDARNYYHRKGMISGGEWTSYQKSLHSQNYPFE